jgi:SOS-response transcriptional repressor LexA
MDDSEAMAGGQNSPGISVHAGFPNPAAERRGTPLSLDRLLIRSPLSTYIFRIRGHQWEERGIFDGDLALIDRALGPRSNELVIIWQDESFAILPFSHLEKQTEPWGTITAIIHQYLKD